MVQKVELLSPAGNAEGFYGAVHAGADAVYLAGDRFGARAYAENFTTQELVECIRYAHLLGRKVYLAVNTLFKEREISELYDYLLPFCQAGLDAVIVQDLGVLRFVREHFPECGIHVSTQMTLCSSMGASLLAALGAERIVPSRELSLEELASLRKSVDLEIETFVHGAMCYSYSGQCLFSSILGGRSGNRGRCAQPCRLPYSILTDGRDRGQCYPLSLKDMCTAEHIPRLIQAGIDSFKIEGRMKKPEYTAGVTEVYRRCIDRYFKLCAQSGPQKAAETFQVEKEDRELLHSLYIRSETQDGYYFRHGGRSMVTVSSPAYSETREEVRREIRERHLETPLKLPVTIRAEFLPGKPACVVLERQGVRACAMGENVDRAKNRPISQEEVKRQLGKLGDSVFCAENMDIVVGEDCFYPLKRINELRREAVTALEEKILAAAPSVRERVPKKAQNKVQNRIQNKLQNKLPQQEICRSFFSRTEQQLEALVSWMDHNPMEETLRLYVEGDLFLKEKKKVTDLCRQLQNARWEFYAALPYILRETDREYLRQLAGAVEESRLFGGFLVRSMDGLGFVQECRQEGKSFTCRADAGVYLWNRYAFQELRPFLDGFCLPYELNAKEQRSLLQNLDMDPDFAAPSEKEVLPAMGLPAEKIVYGRIPMMLTANCLLRTAGCCKKTGESKVGSTALRDRYNKEFPVDVNCRHCLNVIYNSVPLSLHQRQPGRKEKGTGMDTRMDFTFETGEEVRALLDTFFRGRPFPWQEYTSGHEKRGVE